MSSSRLNFIICYFFFCWFFCIFFASGFIDSQDGFQYTAIARRMYFNHSFELPPEEYPNENIRLSKTNSDRRFSPTGLGYSIALIPAVMGEHIFLTLSGTKPISGFPLNADWPVLLFASMTNAVFGAFLCVVLFLYLRSFGLSEKNATLMSFLGLISTNIFVYTKHVYPHIMFMSFLLASFYFIRSNSLNKQKSKLVLSGMCLSVVILSYNQTYLLTIPPLLLYYFFLNKHYVHLIISIFTSKKFQLPQKTTILNILRYSLVDAFFFSIGVLPGWLLYSWFNFVRFGNTLTAGYGEGIPIPLIPPPYALFEGMWGILFSPGRSPFVYSPVLLILIFFWWKLNKKILPEIISFIFLTIIYLVFFGTLMGSPTFMVWHGEMSWGNRYIVAVVPFLWILVSLIYIKLQRYQKILFFLPLILIGIYIQTIGALLPYQIKTAGLPPNLYLTADKTTTSLQYNYGEYPNFLPRISAPYVMTKTFLKRLKELPRMYNYGKYNLVLKDGFEGVFRIGDSGWRGMRPISLITFDSSEHSPKEMTLLLRNHVMDNQSSRSANLVLTLNGNQLSNTITVPADQEIISNIDLDQKYLRDKNQLRIDLNYTGTASAYLSKRQVVFLQGLLVDNQHQNILTLDYPYFSPISMRLLDLKYLYWGGVQREIWDFWYLHSGVYESTFDLWWLRPFHYWDLPKGFFALLFSLNISGIIYFGFSLIYLLKDKKQIR